MDYIITTNISRGFYRRRRRRYAHMRNCRATHEDMPAGRCMVSSKQVADRKAACHALPRVVGHGHGQRERNVEHPAYLLQVSVYVMQGGAVLFPLFVRVGRGYYREEIRCIGTGVAVDYLLKDGFPQEGDFPAGGLGAIDEVAVAYVVLCKMEPPVMPWVKTEKRKMSRANDSDGWSEPRSRPRRRFISSSVRPLRSFFLR